MHLKQKAAAIRRQTSATGAEPQDDIFTYLERDILSIIGDVAIYGDPDVAESATAWVSNIDQKFIFFQLLRFFRLMTLLREATCRLRPYL